MSSIRSDSPPPRPPVPTVDVWHRFRSGPTVADVVPYADARRLLLENSMEALYQAWKRINREGRDEELREQIYISAENLWYSVRRRERAQIYRRLGDFEDTDEDEEDEEDEDAANTESGNSDAPPPLVTAEQEATAVAPDAVPPSPTVAGGTREVPFSVEDECH